MAEKIKLIIVAGPTASSKSDIGMFLADRLGGEIINADSVQVYRHFDIGSAKPSAELRHRIAHHLVDILAPDEEFNAYRFKELARAAAADIAGRGRLPIVVGGTGLYIRSFLYNLFEQDETRVREARRHWESQCDNRGLPFCHDRLREVDPAAADRIHPNDRIRIIRALEYHTATGVPLSEAHRRHGFAASPYEFLILVPLYGAGELADRIDERTARMFESGIVDEVRRIIGLGYSPSIKPLRSIGYKEALMVVDGRASASEAAKMASASTKAYARRQRIWFRKERNVKYLPVTKGDFTNFLVEAKNFLHIV